MYEPRYERKPIVIGPARWDPVTSTTSAAIGYGIDMTKAVVDVVEKPVKAYLGSSPARPARSVEATMAATESNDPNRTMPIDPQKAGPVATSNSKNTRSCGVSFGAAVAACGSSLGHVLALHTKRVFVDVPLATTEGLRAVPRLYGQEVRNYGPIRDWKSGAVVVGKNFGYGMAEGVTDLFIEPVRGGRREGALGVAKGVGKGLASAGTKIPSGKSRQPMISQARLTRHSSRAGLAGLYRARHIQECPGIDQNQDKRRDKTSFGDGRTAPAEGSVRPRSADRLRLEYVSLWIAEKAVETWQKCFAFGPRPKPRGRCRA